MMLTVPERSSGRVVSGERARRAKLVCLLAGVGLVTAACGSNTAASSTTSGATSPPAGGGATTISVKATTVGSLGTVLVDSKGFTLYKYSLDKPAKIACVSSTCVTTWPPLLLPSGDHLATMSGLSTEKRPNGDVQVTYKGSPLYTFSGDTKSGQANGVGIPDWSVAATSSVTGTTKPTSTSGGYGY